MADKDYIETLHDAVFTPEENTFLTIFEKDGKYWVDTGHADVGPLDTRDEAKAHIWRIIDDSNKKTMEREEKGEETHPDAGLLEAINAEAFADRLNWVLGTGKYANPASTEELNDARLTHIHKFEILENPPKGMTVFVCSCDIRMESYDDE
jgi:hypothetical protein